MKNVKGELISQAVNKACSLVSVETWVPVASIVLANLSHKIGINTFWVPIWDNLRNDYD